MLNILLNDKVGLDIVRSISAVLDRAVYWVISVAYDVVTGLANISIFKDETISEFSIRLYTLIGLFMIFRISFSLINYLINPDSLMDKEKGGGKLIQRIIITFILIIAVPQAFNLLSEAQEALLEDKVIEKFFLGEQFDDSGNTVGGHSFLIDERCKTVAGKNPITIAEDGKYIAMLVYRPFFQTDSSLDDSIIGPFLTNDTFYCEASSVSALLTPDIYNAPVISSSNAGIAGTGDYRVDYWFIISALVGGVVACLMVSFCMDIAVRSIKLAFLQIISPIPIMSYIDPSKKSSMFSKWAKEVGKTWLDLFLRLGSIYFAITIISSIDNIWDEASSTNHKYWVLLFIIIGALIFAKKLPSLIESVFGIKLSGNFNLNPFKKIRDEALFGKELTGLPKKAVATTAAMGMNAIGSLNRYKEQQKKLGEMDSKLDDKYSDDLNKKLLQAKLDMTKKMKNFQKLGQMGIPVKDRIRTEAQAYKDKVSQLKSDSAKELAEEKAKLRKFSDNHPIASSILSAGRAGTEAFKMDHKSIKDVIDNASKAATNAAKERTYRDNYGIKDRAMNQITDWGDVKKSGTADIVDRRVKELTDQLNQVNNALDSLRQEQSAFSPGIFVYDSNGEVSVNDSFAFADPMMKTYALENIRMQRQLQQTVKDLNSEIKSQNKILEQSKK